MFELITWFAPYNSQNVYCNNNSSKCNCNAYMYMERTFRVHYIKLLVRVDFFLMFTFTLFVSLFFCLVHSCIVSYLYIVCTFYNRYGYRCFFPLWLISFVRLANLNRINNTAATVMASYLWLSANNFIVFIDSVCV